MNDSLFQALGQWGRSESSAGRGHERGLVEKEGARFPIFPSDREPGTVSSVPLAHCQNVLVSTIFIPPPFQFQKEKTTNSGYKMHVCSITYGMSSLFDHAFRFVMFVTAVCLFFPTDILAS